MRLKLTPARRRGLAVLVHAEECGASVRVSNTTTRVPPDDPATALTIYWQTSRWLVDHNFAQEVFRPDGWDAELTDEGREAAREVGLL